jgi:radical SAM protein with 4Fe4S-binding SPASM domain
MAGMLHWLRYFLPLRNPHPIYLIYFVTSRCMGKCRHCFYWDSLNKPEKALSIEEIEKVSRNLGELLQLTLTGGEPLLRDDLSEIIKIFQRNNNPFNLGLATSGYYPDKLEKAAKDALENSGGNNFTVGLPIEGPPELNDEIRGIKGFFEKTASSIKLLKELKLKFPKLTILVDITASHYNQERLAETYFLVRDQLKPDLINLIITRGAPQDAAAKQIDPDIIAAVTQLLEDDVRSGKILGYGFNTRMLHAKDIMLRRIALQIFQGEQKKIRCQAGDMIGVIYPEGDVYPCELWNEPMGELRKSGYDLRKIWNSSQAQKTRHEIRDRNCVCYHQCFLSPSLFFDPLYMPSLLSEALRLRQAQ